MMVGLSLHSSSFIFTYLKLPISHLSGDGVGGFTKARAKMMVARRPLNHPSCPIVSHSKSLKTSKTPLKISKE